MRLETEFRLCLQRHALEAAFQHSFDVAPPASRKNNQTAIAPSTWVKLLYLPNAYSADEALLLCQCSAQQWLAWVPDYGEMVLEQGQFERLAD